jgi:microcystin-dependent protein
MEGTIGEIRLFGGNFAPRGWLFCDGSLQQISQYDTVYTLLGTTYGGDGQITFGLPDLRGRVPVHIGQGTGLPNVVAGQMGGEENHTLTVSEIPAHIHGVAMTSATTGIKVSTKAATLATATANAAMTIRSNTDGNIKTFNNALPDTVLNAGFTQIMIPNPSAGGSEPHENMQQFQVLNYIICMEGIYPSQP